MKITKPIPGRRATAAAAPLLPVHVGLDEVLRLLHELKGGLDEVRATLQARRKPHYTVDEVAELTGRTPYTVRRWITEERIKAIRITGTGPKGRLLIAREELDAIIGAGLGAKVPDAAVE